MLGFGEIIACKSLGASALSITVLTMLSPITAFAALWWGWILKDRDQRRWVLLLGAIAYLAVLSGAMMNSVTHLLILYALFYLAFTIFGPAELRVMQQHLPAASTGRSYGAALAFRMGIAAAVSAGAGFWLDHHNAGWKQIFPISALVGFIAMLPLASIPTGKHTDETGKHRQTDHFRIVGMNRQTLLHPVRDVLALLKRRKDFLRFEIAFMIYGIAFMMLMPVVPIYLVDNLKLSYATIGLARGSLMALVMIPAMPLFGWLYDRSTPHRMGVWIFTLLAFYPLFLLAAGYLKGDWQLAMVYIAFAWFGVVMSGLTVIWSLSSLRFAKGEDVSVYQSVHVAATGVRGLVAPLFGYLVMTLFSINTALICAAVIWVIAGVAMGLMRRIDRRSGEMSSLRAEVKR